MRAMLIIASPARAIVRVQRVGQFWQAPYLAKIHAGLEQGVMMQRQHYALPVRYSQACMKELAGIDLS